METLQLFIENVLIFTWLGHGALKYSFLIYYHADNLLYYSSMSFYTNQSDNN